MAIETNTDSASKYQCVIEYRHPHEQGYSLGIAGNYCRDEFTLEVVSIESMASDVLEFILAYPSSGHYIEFIGRITGITRLPDSCLLNIRIKENQNSILQLIENLLSCKPELIPIAEVPEAIAVENSDHIPLQSTIKLPEKSETETELTNTVCSTKDNSLSCSRKAKKRRSFIPLLTSLVIAGLFAKLIFSEQIIAYTNSLLYKESRPPIKKINAPSINIIDVLEPIESRHLVTNPANQSISSFKGQPLIKNTNAKNTGNLKKASSKFKALSETNKISAASGSDTKSMNISVHSTNKKVQAIFSGKSSPETLISDDKQLPKPVKTPEIKVPAKPSLKDRKEVTEPGTVKRIIIAKNTAELKAPVKIPARDLPAIAKKPAELKQETSIMPTSKLQDAVISEPITIPDSIKEIAEPEINRDEINEITKPKTSSVVVFDDHFNDNRSNWKLFSTAMASAQIADGKLILENRRMSGVHIIIHPEEFPHDKDFTIEVSLTPHSTLPTSYYGVLIGARDTLSYYSSMINSDGEFAISQKLNGVIQKLASGKIKRLNSFDTIKLSKRDDNLRFSLNGALIYEIKGVKFYGSNIGFILYDKAIILIDRIRSEITTTD
ncbi:hypothetical protein H8E50_09965 [bacterium]|nr:hypothetical protein [bacterium]